VCVPDCSDTGSNFLIDTNPNDGTNTFLTYGTWSTNEELIYSIDGVCVEKCPYAGENMYPDAGYTAQIDYFGAAVAADSASEWLRTASTATNPEQALNYINKGECIPICLEMEGTKYYA